MKLAIAGPALVLAASGAAHAMSDADLEAKVRQRLEGDRTGACMAVAVVESERVARTYACADPADAGRVGPGSAFEIGSISKTMTAALLADLILKGKASLDDPLADYLPGGVRVPEFEGRPILLRHVVTHTSGLPPLPSRMAGADPSDPYAKLDAQALLDSLGDVVLSRAPGERFEYSNFASMLLSYAVARRAGADMGTLLRQRLFEPLGMDTAYVNRKPERARAAQGHLPSGQPTPAWHFATDLTGVGGVRATLDDMVRYVQGQLGAIETPVNDALSLAQRQVSDTPPMAMNWMLAPVGDRVVHVHEGGTGGFSSFVAFDTSRRRGVAILSDTAWTTLGGLGALGMHLVEPSLPPGRPRREAEPPEDLLQALPGEYRLGDAGPRATVERKGDALVLRTADGQEYALGHDDAGDFYPLQFDAVLRPRRLPSGGYALTWLQGGAALPAKRVDGTPAGAPSYAPSAQDLAAYEGEYPLAPSPLTLAVRQRDGTLHAQATGQGEFPLDPVAHDVFEAPAYGIEIRFRRDDAGEVAALELRQAGQVLRGPKR